VWEGAEILWRKRRWLHFPFDPLRGFGL